MVEHTWTTRREGDVTLVEVVLTNGGAATEVRVENCLDGALQPPRRRGVPESGWDESGYAGTVPANGRLGLGYACPARPTEPPIRVTCHGPPEDDAERTPASVVRELGDPRPPRDAVPPR
jgi:hypothetical protein